MKTWQSRTLSITNENRSWLQRAKIVFIHLHPKIGGRIPKDTAALTSVNVNTLLGWFVQTGFKEGWIDLVECMTAGTALQSFPIAVQDLFSMLTQNLKFVHRDLKIGSRWMESNLNYYLKVEWWVQIHELATVLNPFLLLTSCQDFFTVKSINC